MKFKTVIWAALILICASHSASACMMTKQAMVALFNQFDDNKDGKISLEEYVAHEGPRVYKDRPVDQEFLTKRFFDNMDPQKKGFVNQDKFSPISLVRCGG